MATQFRERPVTQEMPAVNVEREYAAHVVRRGFSLQAAGGVAVVALAILALLGVLPMTLLAVAAIALGVAYLIESSSLTSEYPKLFTREDEPTEVAQVGSGAGSSFAAGLSGIVFGILALAMTGAVSATLLAAAAIVYGSGILLGGMGAMKVRHVGLRATPEGRLEHDVATERVNAGAWLTSLCGLGAIVLGIIGLLSYTVPVAALWLTMIAFLAVGVAAFISGVVVVWELRHLYQPAVH
jgi:hypothetical protein